MTWDYERVRVNGETRLKHRVVMEEYLGRELKNDEHIHHKNGDVTDNRPENLQILSPEEHTSLHSRGRGKTIVVLECPECGKIFKRQKRQTFLSKPNVTASFCDNPCSARFYAKGKTIENPKSYHLDTFTSYPD